LLAAYPPLALLAGNVNEARPSDLVEPILLAILGSLMVWGLFWMFLRDAARSGLLASLAVAFFFTIARAGEALNQHLTFLSHYWVARVVHISALYAVVPEILATIGLGIWLATRLTKPRATTLSALLNIFSIVLVTMPAARIAMAKAPGATHQPRQVEPFAVSASPASKPDIYYIILDGYARSDVLRALFNIDNSGFLDRLEQKGFYVARRSTANYAQTPLCLSSSLNSTYLDDLVRGLGNDQTELSELIGRNNVVETLRSLGYKFVTFASGFDPTEHPEADEYRAPYHQFREFHRLLIDLTPLGTVFTDPRHVDLFTMARERTLYLLDHLADVAADPAPTFTFAHLLCPHPPFVFGEDGTDVSHRDDRFYLNDGRKFQGESSESEVYHRGYRAQAIFITKRIEQTINRILAESPEPPIIILQSDHGSGWKLDMQSVEGTDLNERMSILNAYYFPGARYDSLYDTITPVNSFRVVLNSFFGANADLLPDRSFFSTWGNPYKFIDVTDRVRGRVYGQDQNETGHVEEEVEDQGHGKETAVPGSVSPGSPGATR
jgi:hypothetical protein